MPQQQQYGNSSLTWKRWTPSPEAAAGPAHPPLGGWQAGSWPAVPMSRRNGREGADVRRRRLMQRRQAKFFDRFFLKIKQITPGKQRQTRQAYRQSQSRSTWESTGCGRKMERSGHGRTGGREKGLRVRRGTGAHSGGSVCLYTRTSPVRSSGCSLSYFPPPQNHFLQHSSPFPPSNDTSPSSLIPFQRYPSKKYPPPPLPPQPPLGLLTGRRKAGGSL